MPKTYFQNEMKGYVEENILVLKHIHDNTRCILKCLATKNCRGKNSDMIHMRKKVTVFHDNIM